MTGKPFGGQAGAAKRRLVYLLILILLVLHNDFWLWDRVDPLILGWMPIGLFYHVVYLIAALVVLGLMVRFAWPEPPEDILKKSR